MIASVALCTCLLEDSSYLISDENQLTMRGVRPDRSLAFPDQAAMFGDAPSPPDLT
jgi:hypothetical protein